MEQEEYVRIPRSIYFEMLGEIETLKETISELNNLTPEEKLNIKVRKYIKHMKWQEDKIKRLKLQLKDIQSLCEI